MIREKLHKFSYGFGRRLGHITKPSVLHNLAMENIELVTIWDVRMEEGHFYKVYLPLEKVGIFPVNTGNDPMAQSVWNNTNMQI
jgi:hypothetical protein